MSKQVHEFTAMESSVMTETYLNIVCGMLKKIASEESAKIADSANIVKQVIEKDGLIYVFGCGHSHMLSEETFYRAGGLACVAPIFFEPLMLHQSAVESSRLETQSGLYERVLANYAITEKDALICVSTSGINAVPVELANAVKEAGTPVIGICSYAYRNCGTRNPLKKHMSEVCSISIDNKVPHGDACLTIDGLPVSMTPVSTIASAFIINSILAEAARLACLDGYEIPVYLSGNIPGGKEYNKKLIQQYRKRIACL